MLFNYIFLIDHYRPGALSLFENKSCNEFILPLTKEMFDSRKEMFDELYTTEQRFSFLISNEVVNDYIESLENNLVQSITSFLFLPNYIRSDGRQIIFINAESQSDDQIGFFLKKFLPEMDEQGLSDINIEILNLRPDINHTLLSSISTINKDLLSYLSKNEVGVDFKQYFTKFLKLPDLTKKWVVCVDSADTFHRYYSLIEKLEYYLISNEPILSFYIDSYNSSDLVLSKLRNENKQLRIKQQNNMHYLKTLRETSLALIHQTSKSSNQEQGPLFEAEKSKNADLVKQIEYLQANRDAIRDWYTKEYEVLPKWYKRFGHIIKVLIGKRSFRSLFR